MNGYINLHILQDHHQYDLLQRGYSHLLLDRCHSLFNAIRRTNPWWNPPINLPMQGVTTQVSTPNIKTAYTVDK